MNAATDLRAKTNDELNDQLIGLRKEQFNLRFQRASGQLDNLARIKTVRREIARIKTILGQKQHQAVTAATANSTARKG